jgi:hypothetical protein
MFLENFLMFSGGAPLILLAPAILSEALRGRWLLPVDVL